MATKAKTCGQCAHTEQGSATAVWCYGAPPTVLSAKQAENGGVQVQIQRPLIPNDARACALFKLKAGDEPVTSTRAKIFRPKTRRAHR